METSKKVWLSRDWDFGSEYMLSAKKPYKNNVRERWEAEGAIHVFNQFNFEGIFDITLKPGEGPILLKVEREE